MCCKTTAPMAESSGSSRRQIELPLDRNWAPSCESDAISCCYTVDMHLPASAPSDCGCCSETLSHVRCASSLSTVTASDVPSENMVLLLIRCLHIRRDPKKQSAWLHCCPLTGSQFGRVGGAAADCAAARAAHTVAAWRHRQRCQSHAIRFIGVDAGASTTDHGGSTLDALRVTSTASATRNDM